MKKKQPKKTTLAKPRKKSNPIPEWMDEALKPVAADMGILERVALADKLEKQAAQLRDMKPAPIKAETRIMVYVRPNAEKALIAFYKAHGGDETAEKETKLAAGLKWFVESGLPLIATVSAATNKECHYRDTEGLDSTVYNEELIGRALATYCHDNKEQKED